MGGNGRSAQIIRFGIFELELGSGELRKNGAKVPLQGQPFQVFAILLERPGELVTREELRKKVWPEDTFVDFDHALNTAINKIRAAVGGRRGQPQVRRNSSSPRLSLPRASKQAKSIGTFTDCSEGAF